MRIAIAFLDASVLYPAPLRDLLLELAVSDIFRAKWSQAVHEEWIGALLRDRPDLTAERLDRTRRLMDAHVRDAVVYAVACRFRSSRPRSVSAPGSAIRRFPAESISSSCNGSDWARPSRRCSSTPQPPDGAIAAIHVECQELVRPLPFSRRFVHRSAKIGARPVADHGQTAMQMPQP